MNRRLALLLWLLYVAPFLLVCCHTAAKSTAAAASAQGTVLKPSVQDTTLQSTNMDAASANLMRLKEKLDAGIDFTATGSEPFWSLEIDFDKQLHLKNKNGFEMITPVPEGMKAADAPITRYRAVTEGGELIVQLAQQPCINSTSGETWRYTVTVDAKKGTDPAYTTYKGCGTYTADYRINDIWVLEKVNATPLKKEDFIKGLPQLEINLAQKKVFGHTGCNNLNGAAEVQGKKISFGLFATTRMACPNTDFENRYINSLQRRTIPYSTLR